MTAPQRPASNSTARKRAEAHTAENDAPMRVEVDPDAGAMYVHLRCGRVARTVSLSDVVNVDLSADGNALGVEVLGTCEVPGYETAKPCPSCASVDYCQGVIPPGSSAS